ncbi:MAG TPA: hypothetical protein VF659_21280 [Pyrinomonadaceae bacterium]|jgi:hypothetical protein
MPERKDAAGKDDERQVRGRKGPPSQSRGEKNRRPARKGGGAPRGNVPKIGKHDSSRGDTSGDGLH